MIAFRYALANVLTFFEEPIEIFNRLSSSRSTNPFQMEKRHHHFRMWTPKWIPFWHSRLILMSNKDSNNFVIDILFFCSVNWIGLNWVFLLFFTLSTMNTDGFPWFWRAVGTFGCNPIVQAKNISVYCVLCIVLFFVVIFIFVFIDLHSLDFHTQ